MNAFSFGARESRNFPGVVVWLQDVGSCWAKRCEKTCRFLPMYSESSLKVPFPLTTLFFPFLLAFCVAKCAVIIWNSCNPKSEFFPGFWGWDHPKGVPLFPCCHDQRLVVHNSSQGDAVPEFQKVRWNGGCQRRPRRQKLSGWLVLMELRQLVSIYIITSRVELMCEM